MGAPKVLANFIGQLVAELMTQKIDPGISILAVISACYDIFPVAAWLTSYLFQIFAQVLPSQEGLNWPSTLFHRTTYGHISEYFMVT